MKRIEKKDLIIGETSVKTEYFSSCSEKIVLSAKGNSGSGSVELAIHAVTRDGVKTEVFSRKYPVKRKKFSIEHSFDPLYFSVYYAAKELCVTVVGDALEISEFSLFEQEVEHDGEYVSFSNVVEKDGEKRAIIKRLDGSELTVSTVPHKVLFFGNSLLHGMGYYGMCSTDPENDYYHHVTKEILKHDPSCEFQKAHIVCLEAMENTEDFERIIFQENNPSLSVPTADLLKSDIDLILLQGGDNVNTPERAEAFKQNAGRFLRLLKEKCPDARIIWIFGWYNKKNSFEPIRNACEALRVESIDLSELRNTWENLPQYPHRYIREDGTYEHAPMEWLTHPGNTGMYRIAMKILEKIELM